MVQGTGSDVGKSVIVAGLCRIARRRGFKVAPFKPQNMSNNAAACEDGGEIGRAQALQAEACGLSPQVDFNPVLLKPQTDKTSQVVVHGQVRSTLEASKFIEGRDSLLTPVMESFNRLTDEFDLVLVEGAGSPAEINLRRNDIANMGFARQAGVPVCLLGDIERGGVIASIVGTKSVLDKADAAMICGFAINKFRGDPRLFDDGVTAIEARTDWPCFGVIPWLPATTKLPAEDAVSLQQQERREGQQIKIAAPMLSRMANFDDADPLRLEPCVDFQFIPPGQPIPHDCDLIILFGTKSTLGDLAFLRAQGWDHDIISHARRGGRVLGICGGLQMLGTKITDLDGVDGAPGEAIGLGLLNIETQMSPNKKVCPTTGHSITSGTPIEGYEIHTGQTSGLDCSRPMFIVGGERDGAQNLDGNVMGSYVHGFLTNDDYRREFLSDISAQATSGIEFRRTINEALDHLADGLEASLDIDGMFAAAQVPRTGA